MSVLTRGTVVMDLERCKGCELCIPACRPGVLAMSAPDEVNIQGNRYPLLFAGCTACRACREVCPDFVFEVYRFEEPQWLPDSMAPPGAGPGEDAAASAVATTGPGAP